MSPSPIKVTARGQGTKNPLPPWGPSIGFVTCRQTLAYSRRLRGAASRGVSRVAALTNEMEVATEIPSLLDLAKWPEGSRVLLGREQPHPGANCNLASGPSVN